MLKHFFNRDPLHTHIKLLNLIPNGSHVLEIGSSTGYFTREILNKNCSVVSIEKDKYLYTIGKRKNRRSGKLKTLLLDIERETPKLGGKKYDVILLADVLEHLYNPMRVLHDLLKLLDKKNGRVLVSIPNIANFSVLIQLFFGRFDYQEYGLLDRTHLRFFTEKTAIEMFEKCGLSVEKFDYVSGLDRWPVYGKTIGRIVFRVKILRKLEHLFVGMCRNLFAMEFIFSLRKVV